MAFTDLASGSAVSFTITAGGTVRTTSNGGSMTADVSSVQGESQRFYGPQTFRKTFGPYNSDATVTLTCTGGTISYDATAPLMATPAQAAAFPGLVSGAGNPYAITTMGDSRLAGALVSENATNQTRFWGWHWLTVAQQLLGGRLQIPCTNLTATSGLRSDQFMTETRYQQALASNARWLMVGGVLNDVSQQGNGISPPDYFTSNIKPYLLRWLAMGRGVILMAETGAASINSDAGRAGACALYNTRIRQFAASNPNVVIFDLPAAVNVPGSSFTLNSNYSGDGVHTNLVKGGQAAGLAFANLMSPLIPAEQILPSHAGESYANGQIWQTSNPLFITTTGGTLGSSGITASGGTPAGITNSATDAGITGTLTTSAGTYGNDLVLALTATAAGSFTIYFNYANQPIVGDSYEAVGEIEIASGATNFAGAWIKNEISVGGVALASMSALMDSTHGAMDSTAVVKGVHRTMPQAVPAGTYNYALATFHGQFTGAGSATVKLRRFSALRYPA